MSAFESTSDESKQPNIETDIGSSFSGSRQNSALRNCNSANTDIVLSVFWKKGKLAAASYSVSACEVSILNDIVDVSPEFRILNALCLQLRPWKIISCKSLSHVFLKAIHKLALGDLALTSTSPNMSASVETTNDDVSFFANTVQLLPASSFNVETSRRMITALKLAGEPENASEFDRQNYIFSKLNLTTDAESLIAAFGGLLSFLGKSLSQINLQSIISPVLSIRTLSLNNLVWIDSESLKALEVFSRALHPSPYKWKDQSNEGFCVSSLFSRCSSTLGSKHMRVLLSQPTQDLSIIQQRQGAIEFFLKDQNREIVLKLNDYLKNITSVTMMVTRMTNGCTSISQWKSFYKTVYFAVLIGETCQEHGNNVQFFSKISALLCDSLYVMGHCIYRIIDFDDSVTENRFCVRAGICEKLDKLKNECSRLPAMLSRLMEQEIEHVPECADTYYMMYLPEVGYLLAVSEWNQFVTDGQMKNLPGLSFRFTANGVSYFKTACCYELDQLIGDVWVKIIEEESKIMLYLLDFIQCNIHPLLAILEPICELDCLLEMSRVARELNYVRPDVIKNDSQLLEIRGGRHPLQELLTDSFIRNDTISGPTEGLVQILTGPNCSGKSIYLKQVALIALLAHVGSFVPADSVVISVLDQIHTRIQAAESVASQLSAFLTDLRQITLSLYNSTDHSLVVIDEFGKGTAEVDGLAILVGCVNHFVSRGSKCPHLFMSTHFQLLADLVPITPAVKFLHPDYILEDGELVPLYLLKPGSVQMCYANQFASAIGLPDSTIHRANQIHKVLRKQACSDAGDYNRQQKNITYKLENIIFLMATEFQNEQGLQKVVTQLQRLWSYHQSLPISSS